MTLQNIPSYKITSNMTCCMHNNYTWLTVVMGDGGRSGTWNWIVIEGIGVEINEIELKTEIGIVW